MGLLTILKKMKQKEKEIRLLMLYHFKLEDLLLFVLFVLRSAKLLIFLMIYFTLEGVNALRIVKNFDCK